MTLPGEAAQKLMLPQLEQQDRFNQHLISRARPSAVIIMFYPFKGRIYFPLIQRPFYAGAHSGQISLPGGKKEQHDQDLIDTALRETEEEIGVKVKKEQILGCLSTLFVPVSNFNIWPMVAAVEATPAFKPDPVEVANIIQCPLNHLLDPGNVKATTITTRSNLKINAPYFSIQEQIVWGATAMILSELKAILSNSPAPG